jgi:hypothetical protein
MQVRPEWALVYATGLVAVMTGLLAWVTSSGHC